MNKLDSGFSPLGLGGATVQFLVAAALLIVLVGCIGRGPSRIRPPRISASDVASAAIEQCDTNGNGAIDRDELTPSLRFAADRVDQNGNDQLEVSEIEQFVQKTWVDTTVGIIALRCEVAINGRPLNGATVTFEPEPFMGDKLKPATAILYRGTCMPDIADEDRPHENAHGVLGGFYNVRVSLVEGGEERIPTSYNAATTLGCDVGGRAPYMPGPVSFRLSTRKK